LKKFSCGKTFSSGFRRGTSLSIALQSYFNTVYNDTHLKIQRFISSKYTNIHDIEDILQEVYLEFYKTLCKHGTDYITEPEPFLIDIAKKKLSKRYSLKNRLKRLLPLTKTNEQDEEYTRGDFSDIEGSYDDIDEALIKQETIDAVWQIINAMGAQTIEIFRLRYLEELQIDAISERMNLPKHTVKNKLYRTMEEIRQKIER
jgi:RNA polymerase sigma factor (sigma-70 family)